MRYGHRASAMVMVRNHDYFMQEDDDVWGAAREGDTKVRGKESEGEIRSEGDRTKEKTERERER